MSARKQSNSIVPPEPAQEIVVALSHLVRSSDNVRTEADCDVTDLVASIAAHGVIQNLVVTAELKKSRPTGRYAVIAGGRRLKALQQLLAEKRIAADYPVRCLEVHPAHAIELSTVENIARTPLSPADEFEAYRKLADTGKTLEAIAAAFGVTVLHVKRRLKLAQVSPRLLALYRQGDMTLDQLMALALSDDHAQQEGVWDATSAWQREPHQLRAMLTEHEVDGSTHPLARFVGVDAYIAAGGTLRRDLFTEEDVPGYFTDTALLHKLAQERLAAAAEAVRAEGMAWVVARPQIDYSTLSEYGRCLTVQREPTPDEQGQISTLEAHIRQLEAAADALGDAEGPFDDAQADALAAEIESNWEALEGVKEVLQVPDPALYDLAGAIVTIDSDGTLSVRRHLIRPEDRAQQRSRATERAAPGCTGPAKREFSERLYRELTAHRTAALQVAIATHPDVGRALLAWRLARAALYSTFDAVVGIRIDRAKLQLDAPDIEQSPAMIQFHAQREAWLSLLPESDEGTLLLNWALAADSDTLVRLIAFCTACAFTDVQASPQDRPIAARIEDVTGLDMADWYTPTAGGYLKSVPKAKVLEALREAVSPEFAQTLKDRKRDALLTAAEHALAGTRWLPKPLRRA